MRRTLYWKRLLIVAVAGLALCGTVLAVHRYQVKSQSSILKDRAVQAAKESEADPARRDEALNLMRQYLKFQPGDEDAYQKYAEMLLELVKARPAPANTQRAAAGLEEFLRAFPNHPAERQRLARLYINTAQFAKLPIAKQHIEMLLDTPGGEYRGNAEVLEMAATCEQGVGNVPAAIGYLEEAIKTGNAPVRLYLTAMDLHHSNKGDPKRSTAIENHLRELRSGRFAGNLEARVAAARFEMFLGNLAPADADLKEAFEKLGGANSADALLAMAELEIKGIEAAEQAVGRHEKAEKHLRKAFEIDRKNVSVGMLLAEVLSLLGKKGEGIAVLKQTAEALEPDEYRNVLVVDRLIDLGEQNVSASLVEARLAPSESMRAFVPYFRGRLAVLRADWTGARKLLEESAPSLARVPLYHKKAMVGLASCYSAMQNPDKQLEYCRLALRDDGGYPLAMIGEAEALVRMGKDAEALQKYRVIVYTLQLAGYRDELARLELHDVLVQPVEAGLRDWARFEESLGPAASRTPGLHILHAESLAARGQAAEAVRVLRDWLKAHPKDPKAPDVWVALARIADGTRAGNAGKVLDEAEKSLGDAVAFRLARAGVLVARARPAAPAEFEALAAGAEKFSRDERSQLLFGLGQAAARVANRGPDTPASKALRDLSIKLLRAAADLSPRDLTCRAHLLDQGLAAGRMDVVNLALKEMAGVEGEGGPVGALGRIAVRLPQVKKITDPDARAAELRGLRELARRVKELRPGWSRVYIALAQFDEAEGLNDAALAHYTEAIDKGDRQEYVIRRAVELYRLKQQDDKAVGLLSKLGTEVRLPDDLERYRSIYKMLAADIPKESRPTIDRIAPAASTDYQIQLLRGSLLAAIRDDEDALSAFRRAVELADTMPQTWGSLVSQLVRYGKLEDAKRAAAEAKKKLTAAAPPRPEQRAELSLALGGLYEMIGDPESALGYYNAACEAAPAELNPARQRILFFQRTGQGDRATLLLKEAANSAGQDIARWARRHLAVTMMSRPDAHNLRGAALALVGQNLAAAPDAPEDLKARAVIRTADPATREEGVRELRKYGDRGELTPDEFFLLGRLAFDQGKFVEAERYFKLAARVRPGVTAGHMAALVRVYLALNRLDLAEIALERLKANSPASWEAVREEARLLNRKSKDRAAVAEFDDAKKFLDQARGLIHKYPGWDSTANLASRSGPLFEELGLTADAESAYKKFLEEDKSPSAHLALAHLYIMHKQPEKAIKLAREREKSAPVLLTARLLTGAVRMKRPGAGAEAEIEAWLDRALRDAAGKPELEAALSGAKAELLDAQGKYDEAIAAYEQSLARGKSDLVTNNLCMLLALHSPARAEEAVKMMSGLIAARGPVPSFLDTRAVAYLVSSRPAEAKKDLDMALVQYDRPAYRFHLAWALDLDNRESVRIFAVDELKKARQLGLAADDLHPIESERYTELLKKYRLPIDPK